MAAQIVRYSEQAIIVATACTGRLLHAAGNVAARACHLRNVAIVLARAQIAVFAFAPGAIANLAHHLRGWLNNQNDRKNQGYITVIVTSGGRLYLIRKSVFSVENAVSHNL